MLRACNSRVEPTPVAAPTLLAHSPELAAELGFDPEFVQATSFAQVFGGNALLKGMDPNATCYGGHQFGHWAGQLGDGRAINLGELVDPQGRHQVLQLKGAGPTPYSRGADGRAVLRSSIREFLCSEAMFHLGVPTTRALSLVGTGDEVLRDMFYDGRSAMEPGAIVCRVAPSFLRFGNYQICSMRRDEETLKQLVRFTLTHVLPELGHTEPDRDGALALVYEVARRTAVMVLGWMRVGFVHGVMNTDNMSVLGLTIDYGPYGWIDDYDPDWTPNTTDAQRRRYRFGEQPQIALWNLARFAESLLPLVGEAAPLEEALRGYVDVAEAERRAMWVGKLGLKAYREGADAPLIEGLLGLLTAAETDMTIFFRELAAFDPGDPASGLAAVTASLYAGEPVPGWIAWLQAYASRLTDDGRPDADRRAAMNAANPRFVLRNYLAQLAIDRAQAGDLGGVHELLDTMRRPYDDQPGREHLAGRRPDWARHKAGCSMLSCSS